MVEAQLCKLLDNQTRSLAYLFYISFLTWCLSTRRAIYGVVVINNAQFHRFFFFLVVDTCRYLLNICPGFRAFFLLVYFFERTRPAASMRPPCLIYLSTSVLGVTTRAKGPIE